MEPSVPAPGVIAVAAILLLIVAVTGLHHLVQWLRAKLRARRRP